MQCKFCGKWMKEKYEVFEMNMLGYTNVKYPISTFSCECGASATVINAGYPRWSKPKEEIKEDK